ncbi:hypothetical protein EVAR_8758_1 [Eumeta japonica]|uniref:Uncharacterized protein n=1 Tax=Eumeta variegata TaxID=151549 RepID=A0A4C1TTP9_EUMVA|nr:hypothetical protein EVAR_8758_1 [Eumeta japonica]
MTAPASQSSYLNNTMFTCNVSRTGSSHSNTTVLLRTAQLRIVDRFDREYFTRCLIDSGSQLVPRVTAKLPDLPCDTSPLGRVTYLPLADDEYHIPVVYMDDLVSSSAFEYEVAIVTQQFINLFKAGGFDLVKWTSNSS